MGMAACGKIAFFSTFAAFLTRAADFLRMAALGQANIKIVGTHAGVSIGEDGSSQMGLEDLSMCRAHAGKRGALSQRRRFRLRRGAPGRRAQRLLLYPHQPSRDADLLRQQRALRAWKVQVVRKSDKDKITVVAAGVTFFEALKAYDELKKEGIPIRLIDIFSVKPIDADALILSGKATNNRILVVEDHYQEGGIGEAVMSAVAGTGIRVEKLSIHEIPHSGKPQELLDKYGLSAPHIKDACKRLI